MFQNDASWLFSTRLNSYMRDLPPQWCTHTRTRIHVQRRIHTLSFSLKWLGKLSGAPVYRRGASILGARVLRWCIGGKLEIGGWAARPQKVRVRMSRFGASCGEIWNSGDSAPSHAPIGLGFVTFVGITPRAPAQKTIVGKSIHRTPLFP